jgi:ATP-dependent DNA ligase
LNEVRESHHREETPLVWAVVSKKRDASCFYWFLFEKLYLNEQAIQANPRTRRKCEETTVQPKGKNILLGRQARVTVQKHGIGTNM